MKIVSSLYRTLLFVAIISQTACKKDTLPAETAEGRNVVACYVDGKLVRNRAPFGNTTPLYDCFYQHKYNSENGYYFHLSAKDKSNTNVPKSIYINVDSLTLYEGQVITLGNPGTGKAHAQYNEWHDLMPEVFATTDIAHGELLIKKLDLGKGVIAGTFWFDAVHKDGKRVRVTDGRFDMDL